MTETPQANTPEEMVGPANVALLAHMLSEDFRQSRIEWLQDHLSGGNDVAIGHAARLHKRSRAQHEVGIQESQAGNYETAQKHFRDAETTQATNRQIFGETAISEVYKAKNALELAERSYPRIKLWGDKAADTYSKLIAGYSELDDGIDRAQSTPPATNPNAGPGEYEAYLKQKKFIPYSQLEGSAHERALELTLDPDATIEIPVSNLVSAGSFNDWSGGGRVGKNYTTANGQAMNSAKSIDVIKDYAMRPTELPPLEGVTMFIQPDGEVLYAAPVSNHRSAAAIARGQETVLVSGSVEVRLLNENIVDSSIRQ